MFATFLQAATGTAHSWQAQKSAGSATIVQPGAPGQTSKTLTPEAADTSPRGPSEDDVKFMQGMIMHHAQAVEMTELLRTHGSNKELQEFGKRISISQTDEIRFMKQWLEDRGKPVSDDSDSMAGMDMSGMDHMKGMPGMNGGRPPLMPGMLTPQQMAALASANGQAFDHLFLTGMIQHHTGALIMVQQLFAIPGSGQDSQLFDFANDVDNTQQAEIDTMQNMLQKEKR
jgi:uncharacterized protein (DUF305 family)